MGRIKEATSNYTGCFSALIWLHFSIYSTLNYIFNSWQCQKRRRNCIAMMHCGGLRKIWYSSDLQDTEVSNPIIIHCSWKNLMRCGPVKDTSLKVLEVNFSDLRISIVWWLRTVLFSPTTFSSHLWLLLWQQCLKEEPYTVISTSINAIKILNRNILSGA